MLLDGLKGGVDERFLEVLKSHDVVTVPQFLGLL